MRATTICGLLTLLTFFSCGIKAQNTETKTGKAMKTKTPDFTTTILVNKTPKEVFNAINNVRRWWSEEIEGITDKLNGEFTYHYKDVHVSKMKIIEFVRDKKVVWLVLDNQFSFTKDKTEWKGNKIVFEITKKGKNTQLTFTQLGLVPEYECYEVCQHAWSNYINNSLRSLIVTGQGQPNSTENPKTEDERRLGAGK